MKLIAPITLSLAVMLGAGPALAHPADVARGVAVYAPRVTQTVAGERIAGQLCRQGPHSAVWLGKVTIERLDAAGGVAERQVALVPAALRDRGPRCARYHMQTAWAGASPVRVCLASTAGEAPTCVTSRP